MNLGSVCRVSAILPLLMALGCSGGGKPIKVEGKVTLDGKPLPEALIQFLPEGEQGGPPANGLSGTDGTFRLTTFNSGDGALPGTYKVTVTVGTEEDSSHADLKGQGGEGTDPSKMMGAMKDYQGKNKKPGPKKSSLPASYSDPKKTTLKQVIPPPDGKVILELRSSGS